MVTALAHVGGDKAQPVQGPDAAVGAAKPSRLGYQGCCSQRTHSSTLLSSSCRWSLLKIGLFFPFTFFFNYLAAFAAPGFYGWKAESN